MIKRPLLWMSIAFIVGIVLYEQPMPLLIILAVAGILYAVSLLLLEKRQSLPCKDYFLLLLPLCLFAGVWCADREDAKLLEKEQSFVKILENGEEVYAAGTIQQITKKKNESYELLLKDCILSNCEEISLEAFLLFAQKSEKERESNDSIYEVGQLLLYVDSLEVSSGKLERGDLIQCYGQASLFDKATNLGQFDSALYYRQKGITGKISGIRLTLLSAGSFTPGIWFDAVKEYVYDIYASIFTEEDAGVLFAMLLGEKAFLDTELKLLYQESGISHILAVSGLHVSMLGMAVYQIVRHSPVGRNKAICLACLFVFVYGSFTNFSISTERAVWMFLLSMFARLTGKTYDMPIALALSAVLTLISNPLAIGTASFLLSYTAVIGIIIYQMLAEQFKTKMNRKPVWFETLGVSLCIQLVMLPMLLYFFYEVSLYSIFLNLLVIPLASLLLFSGIMTALAGGISHVAGVFFSGTAGTILAWYKAVCGLFGKLPFSLLLVGKPELWQIVVYYVILLSCLLAFVYWKKTSFFIMSCLACLVFFIPWKQENELVFLDVSQGDCMVLQDKRAGAMLIDCGSTDEKQVGTYRLLPYLKAKGISALEVAIVTHADADHMNGIRELLENMEPLSKWDALFYKGNVRVKRLLLPDIANPDESYKELVALANQKQVPVSFVSAQEQLNFGDWQLLCLYPEKDAVTDSKNNSSLVFYVSCGAFDALLTGDVESDGEEKILQSGILRQYGIEEVEVLKVAHHGSYTSSSEAFLTAVKPVFAIVSCGAGNRYGHPHVETIERLGRAGSTLFYTMQSGQVTVKVQRESIEIIEQITEE